jgi:hypothetical protein
METSIFSKRRKPNEMVTVAITAYKYIRIDVFIRSSVKGEAGHSGLVV